MEHGWLTTLRADGSPRTARVWFVEDRIHIWIATSVNARKVDDVQRDPRVAFGIEGQHRGFRAAASLVEIDDAPEIARLFADRYSGWDVADRTVDGPRVLLRLAPVPPTS